MSKVKQRSNKFIKNNLEEYLKFKDKYDNLLKTTNNLESKEDFIKRTSKKHKKKKKSYLAKKIKKRVKKEEFNKLISLGEARVLEYLNSNNIYNIQEHIFRDLINPKTGEHLRMDFYIPEMNTCIEYDGKQHFEIVPDFHGDDLTIAKKKLSYQKYRDNLKNIYCKERMIKLIRIPYKDYYNIEKILKTSLN